MPRPIVIALVWLWASVAWSQDRFTSIAQQLDAAIVDHPGLDGQVELSVNGATVTEFIRGIGITHQLNITIDPNVKGEVVNTFSNARVADVILYVCKRYDLDLEFIGGIIALKPYAAPVPPPLKVEFREPNVRYHADSALVDMDLQRDSLAAVARAITTATGTNVILAPGLESKLVSVFQRGSTLAGALEKLAFSNGLVVERSKDGAFLLRGEPIEAGNKTGGRTNGSAAPGAGQLEMRKLENGRLLIDARNCPTSQVIEQASIAEGKSYFLYDAIDKPVTAKLEDVTYPELLAFLLKGTDYTHLVSDGVHLIGKRDLEGLRRTEILRLHHRPVKDVLAAVPEGLRKNITLAEFMELNGIVISGDAHRIEEVKTFLRAIDQVVPVVMIEVMIVDVNRSRTLNAGIKAGLGGGPTESGGALLPGVEYNMNSSTLNSLINSFNGFGVFNLGNVAQAFYMSIQALETDGVLRMRSTPQLSTLNGHEATLSIGQTEFYLEVQNNVIGTQNPTIATSQIYKPIKADLSLKILPIVSSADMVTLEIEVNQSNFTNRIAATAPPGSVERKFSSIVRAANKDMVVLGGLEEKEINRSGSGLPLLSRVPVLKWFFGSRSHKNRRSKLTIFIRPTIIY